MNIEEMTYREPTEDDFTECYSPNDNPYPLCIGNGSEDCNKCCIYEDMDEPPFEK